MTKCLLLGANGFVGSHLVDELVANGDEVRAFDRFSNGTQFLPNKNIEIVKGDILNKNDIHEALLGIDYVFHFISTTNPATADKDPLLDIETNVRMSLQLFDACVQHKIKRVIFASTGGAMYGEVNQETPIKENICPQPISPYAIGKLTIENYLRFYQKKHKLDSVIFRISNAYGERCSLNKHQGVIPIFLHHLLCDKPITILGDGSMIRDYIYVKDLTKLIAEAYKDASQPLYNIGSGIGVSINELVEIIKKVTHKSFKINYAPKPATFVDKIVLDTILYRDEFRIKPEISLAAGIEMTWEYMKEQHSASKQIVS